MKIFIAGTSSHKIIVEKNPPKFILESFYYIQEWQIPLIKKADDFLLDSGAFTFMQNSKNTDWEGYIKKYAKFIKENEIEKFFELDIDNVIGYDGVVGLRKILEEKSGRKCIPVWHKGRKVEEFKKHCQEYEYVAIGGIITKEIKPKQHDAFMPLIQIAHENGCKVHGLGFTHTDKFDKIKFDSVDSTTWTVGGRMGNLCYFTGKSMKQYYPSLKGKKPKDTKKIMEYNYNEWLKFQKYAERNL